ncbi:hypothetical protein EF847_10880 [Actinobacteria bacterium YIM 96077]|uniref:DUF3800 domain-containing protein n=1 Tax=Phytoactinopolyspora halophila TaxID=1981511 RepID=A0A329QYY5_9ACTN|nr:hypothetical protein [Phytoactinopolyspora halophila]AYY13126.1 hypothetical protein EF847_10880 [Actinobacteria bacterium YIM 96077]RAW17634.1 hypothetical protein DPM12_06545 [Phytoactinopolyspora halophila]
MTPPAGPGQATVLKSHYARVGTGPVAFLDETYHVERDGRRRFYVMAAVVVLHDDRDPLRNELDNLVPDGWWHTTDELRTNEGREHARSLLQTFRIPDEACVVVDKISVAEDDKDGMQARGAVLGKLLDAVHSAESGLHPRVNLAVIEEQREARKNNFDRSVRKRLITEKTISESMALVAVSPGSEHLLWLPDLVCSAYRQKMLLQHTDLFKEIEELTHVVQLQ